MTALAAEHVREAVNSRAMSRNETPAPATREVCHEYSRALPHLPRVHRGRVWLLHSGAGQLVLVNRQSGTAETVTELPGYTRGLTLYGHFALIGLSKIRATSMFGGMPIAERRPERKCGVGVVDLRTGRLVAHLEFVTGVEEIFDVQVLPGVRCPALSGPYPTVDGGGPIWMEHRLRFQGQRAAKLVDVERRHAERHRAVGRSIPSHLRGDRHRQQERNRHHAVHADD